MFFWIINMLIFLLYSTVLSKVKKNEKFLLIAFIHLGIIAAFRNIVVGTDTYNYSNAYNILKSGERLTNNHVAATSKVFIVYLKLGTYLFHDTVGYMIVTALPTLLNVFLFIKHYSKNYFVSVYLYCTLYFYFYSMNAARQFLAISFILCCYYFINNKKYIISIVVFIFACSIHSAACIFGIYYVIHFIKWNVKKMTLFILGIVIAASFITKFIDLFLLIFPYYRWAASALFSPQYLSMGRTSAVYAGYCFITVIISLLTILQSQKKIAIKIKKKFFTERSMNEKELQGEYEKIIIIFVAFCIEVLYPNNILLTRMSYALLVFLIVFLGNSLKNICVYQRLISFFVLAPLFLFMLFQLAGNYSGVLNYNFYY